MTHPFESGRSECPSAGLVSGTMLDCEYGWRRVETLAVGDRVFTLNGALRPIRKIDQQYMGNDLSRHFPNGLILVPGGAIGNCEAFYLLPDALVLFSSDAVRALSGDSAALVRGADLAGHAGIAPAVPVDGIEIIGLAFDEEELVYANTGVRLLCPDLCATRNSSLFPVLSRRDAAILMACWDSRFENDFEQAGRPPKGGRTGSRTAAA